MVTSLNINKMMFSKLATVRACSDSDISLELTTIDEVKLSQRNTALKI